MEDLEDGVVLQVALGDVEALAGGVDSVAVAASEAASADVVAMVVVMVDRLAADLVEVGMPEPALQLLLRLPILSLITLLLAGSAVN